MARPQKHTVDYFPHDADASEGRTLSILFNAFGHEGISCWWQLLERVSKTDNHVISLRNGEDLEYLAAKFHFRPERLEEILTKMADLDAIDKELFTHGLIWLQNFVNRVEAVYKTRKQSLPSKPSFIQKETELINEETSLLPPENPQTKLKETKVNKKVVKKQPSKLSNSRAEIFEGLRARRGYNLPKGKEAGEALAMSWMLQQGYSPAEILKAHDKLKEQPFWKDKPLTMMSLQGQIGEALKNPQDINRGQALEEAW